MLQNHERGRAKTWRTGRILTGLWLMLRHEQLGDCLALFFTTSSPSIVEYSMGFFGCNLHLPPLQASCNSNAVSGQCMQVAIRILAHGVINSLFGEGDTRQGWSGDGLCKPPSSSSYLACFIRFGLMPSHVVVLSHPPFPAYMQIR